jgi:general secretion pathway protein A
MYESFFGFRERPFDLTPNPRYLVLTDAHREALSNLEYAIASRKGVTLLLGEAGTGKTTVIRTALERQPEQVHCVQLHNPALRRNEFVEMLATRFGLSPRATQSKTTLLLELEGLLAARRGRGESSILVIDEAQSLPLELLEEIRLLANIETAHEKLLSVILAGQPELADRLNERSLRQLKQRVALRCELRPLTLLESCAYIAGRIRAAGGVGAQTFTREAVILMHERAHGIPRTLSVIADNALLAGFAVQRRPVSTQLVQEVCGDLDLHAAKDAGAAAPMPTAMTLAPKATVPSGTQEATERMGRNRLITFDSAGPADEDTTNNPRPGMAGNRAAAWRRRFSFFRATV